MFTNNSNIDVIRNAITARLQNEGFMPDTRNFQTLFQKLAGFPYNQKAKSPNAFEY